MSIKVIHQHLFLEISQKAVESERKRTNYNFHQLPDPAQRFLNAIEPDSYIRPHQHINPLKDEAFLIMKGHGAVIWFSEQGDIEEIIELSIDKGIMGVDIPGGLYHTIVSLESGSVFYEVKAGPFNPTLDKGFAEWAPEENTQEAVDYLNSLKSEIVSVIATNKKK